VAAVGDVLGAYEARGRWIHALAALRDATAEGGKATLRFEKIAVTSTAESMRLTVDGQTLGPDYDVVGAFRTRLQKGVFEEYFPRVNPGASRSIKGAGSRVECHVFQLVAESPAARWRARRIDATPQAAAGPEGSPAHEVACLDYWLSMAAGTRPGKGVSNIRDRVEDLLDLRLETGAQMAHVSPRPVETRPGEVIGRYRVAMTIVGPYDGLLRFLDGIHAWGAPVRITLEGLEESDIGLQAKLAFEFLSYEPLKVRLPALWGAVAQALPDDPEAHTAAIVAFAKRLPPPTPRKPYETPEDVVDPFPEPEPVRGTGE
jgi:hypothetical protein